MQKLNFTLSGLTQNQVEQRVSQGFVNHATRTPGRTQTEIFLQNIFSVFNGIILLVIGFVLFFYLRTQDFRLVLDSVGIFSVALLNTVIAIFQELRAKSALDKVNLLLKRNVNVLREGVICSIPPQDVVQDDLVVLTRGDQAVVDGKVVQSNHLEMDESLITGESLPVGKEIGDTLLSGSFATAGNALMRADKIGSNSFAATVTGLAQKAKITLSPLQKRINIFIESLFVIALILIALQLLSELWQPSGLSEADYVRKLATIISSLIPQGLVLFSSVTFALGIFRISNVGALIQKLNAIESFSSIKVICTDKTGTLTENRLQLESLIPLSSTESALSNPLLLGTYAQLSVEKNATLLVLQNQPFVDDAILIDEIPFSSRTKYGVVKFQVQEQVYTCILGGWDILSKQIDSQYKEKTLNTFVSKNIHSLRNLLFAQLKGDFSWDTLKENALEVNLYPLSIVSLSDTVRTDVYEALDLFAQNNIQVKVLSGDAPESVMAILQTIGWKLEQHEMITGSQLDLLSKEEFARAALERLVFARLTPQHKLDLIRALKAQGVRTAMLGDGVNDLPAIKEADLGIAMEEGAAITREVADIVLLKNKFSLLPQIFHEGNKIVNTVIAVSKLFLTKNLMVIVMSLLSILFLWDFPLTPRRISFLNMLGIGIPAAIFAIGNRNTAPHKSFLLDILSHITVSAIVIVGAAYISILQLPQQVENGLEQSQMVMVFISIFLFILNFVWIGIQSKGKLGLFLGSGLGLLVVLVFVTTVDTPFELYTLLRSFYEMETISGEFWPGVILVSLLSGVLLIVAHTIRKWLLDKLFSK